ncbi:hypothetical protein [Nocardia sp. NPDC020380]|uniref:hypothetical protein n=1 Tax=Nocardia sp. NPDC020380 TaxID=3364309 RepID=UPI0037A48BD8
MSHLAVFGAGLVNYLNAVDAEVRPHGVRVSSLQIPQLVERSAAAALFDQGHFDGIDVGEVVRISPDELAAAVFDLATAGTVVERVA